MKFLPSLYVGFDYPTIPYPLLEAHKSDKIMRKSSIQMIRFLFLNKCYAFYSRDI